MFLPLKCGSVIQDCRSELGLAAVSSVKDAVMCSADNCSWGLTSVFSLHIRPHVDDAAQPYLALSFFGSDLSFRLPLMPFMFNYFS